MAPILKTLLFLSVFLSSLIVQSARGVLIDFEEFASVTQYTSGQSFIASGVRFRPRPLLGMAGDLQNTPTGIGTPSELGFGSHYPIPGRGNAIYPRSAQMDFAGTIGRQSFVAIPFYHSGGTVNLGINGNLSDSPLAARGSGMAPFQTFDGMTVNGVSINIVALSSSQGRIELTGPIDSVIFGGQEAVFDTILAMTSGQLEVGDFDGDGSVDGRDFLIWQRNPLIGKLSDWQENYGSATSVGDIAVPEPASVLLLALGVVGSRRRSTCSPVRALRPRRDHRS